MFNNGNDNGMYMPVAPAYGYGECICDLLNPSSNGGGFFFDRIAKKKG